MPDLAATNSFDEEFAADVLYGLASLTEEDFGRDSLPLALSVSLWTRRRGVSFSEAVEMFLLLRAAVLDSASLDEKSEPVPLLHSDTRTTLLSLACYLGSLIARAGRNSGLTRREIAERASFSFLASSV